MWAEGTTDVVGRRDYGRCGQKGLRTLWAEGTTDVVGRRDYGRCGQKGLRTLWAEGTTDVVGRRDYGRCEQKGLRTLWAEGTTDVQPVLYIAVRLTVNHSASGSLCNKQRPLFHQEVSRF